jgi:hypothetical protein
LPVFEEGVPAEVMAPAMAGPSVVIAPAIAGLDAATGRALEVVKPAAATWVKLLATAGYWLEG